MVDSSIISRPGWAYLATSSAAAMMWLMSGSLVLRRGVGTAMLTVSSSAMTEESMVARNVPQSTYGRRVPVGTSWMWERPAFNAWRTVEVASMPVTEYPALANSMARGRPT